jgi:hypothetical protein
MTGNYLTIQVHPSIQQEAGFKIFNVMGQKMENISNQNQHQYKVDVSHFSNGIYYLTSTANNKTYKFIKK